MTRNTSKDLLKTDRIVHQLLHMPGDAAAVKPLTDELAETFGFVAGIDTESDMNESSIQNLTTGVAISPVQAAKCLKEMLRTQIFLKGVYQALQDKLKTKGEVKLMYAGTGPYGSIVLPVLRLLREQNIKVHLIDIHRENCIALKKILHWMDIEHMVDCIECCDATSWKPQSTRDTYLFDIVVSETMNTFLNREPQFHIFANLCQFLNKNGILLPESIDTGILFSQHPFDAELFKRDRLTCQNNHGPYYELLQLNLRLLTEFNYSGQLSSYEHSNMHIDANNKRIRYTVVLPHQAPPFDTLYQITAINVYKQHRLESHQCSLTIPNSTSGFVVKGGQSIVCDYQLVGDIGWQFHFSDYWQHYPLLSHATMSKSGIHGLPRFWDRYRRIETRGQSLVVEEEDISFDLKIMNFMGVELTESIALVMRNKFEYERFESELLEKGSKTSGEVVKFIEKRSL